MCIQYIKSRLLQICRNQLLTSWLPATENIRDMKTISAIALATLVVFLLQVDVAFPFPTWAEVQAYLNSPKVSTSTISCQLIHFWSIILYAISDVSACMVIYKCIYCFFCCRECLHWWKRNVVVQPVHFQQFTTQIRVCVWLPRKNVQRPSVHKDTRKPPYPTNVFVWLQSHSTVTVAILLITTKTVAAQMAWKARTRCVLEDHFVLPHSHATVFYFKIPPALNQVVLSAKMAAVVQLQNSLLQHVLILTCVPLILTNAPVEYFVVCIVLAMFSIP